MKGQTSTAVGSEHSSGSPHTRDISSYSKHYIEEDSLGRGGAGKVKRCKHNLDEKYYAVKIIPYNEEKEEEMLNEIKIFSIFQNANVVRYYYSWKGDSVLDSTSSDANSSTASLAPNKTLYIAMELCKGTLRDAFIEKRDFGLEENGKMFKGMAEGLKCIHEEDVIHCDISPDNIFLDSRGEVKIGDFGLAEVLREGRSCISCEPRGKALYHAPELDTQDDDEKPRVEFSKATDVYALALVMLQMMYP